VSGARRLIVIGLTLVAVACSPAAPQGGAGGSAGSSPAPSGSSSAGSAAPSAVPSTGPTAAASVDQVCANVAKLRAALATLKGLSATSPVADLRAAVHDVGQAGATLIVVGAAAKDLQKLNHEAILVLGFLDAGQGPAAQDLAEFETTAQSVLDELASCP